MNSIVEIEKAIEQLPESEQRQLAAWFSEHRLIVEASGVLAGIYDDEDGGESQLIEDETR
jgi:hypothetical protein